MCQRINKNVYIWLSRSSVTKGSNKREMKRIENGCLQNWNKDAF